MSDTGKAALNKLAGLIDRAEASGGTWSIDEQLESLAWSGGDKLQDEGALREGLRRRVAFVVDVPAQK